MKSASGLFSVLAIASAAMFAARGGATISDAWTPTASAEAAAPADAEARIVEDSMHEFMEYVFQPTYRRLKVTMASAPENNSGWKAIKSDALILAESCNLLFVRVPEEGGADWKAYAAASRDTGAELYQAARSKNFEAATAAYKSMLTNCNACHKQFENGKHILTP